MGGTVSKKKVCSESGEPINYFCLKDEYDWILGGSIPAFKEMLDFLKQKMLG